MWWGSSDSDKQLDQAEIYSIWNEYSERVVFVQDNGNVIESNDRYVTYDYSRDTLTVEAKDALPVIQVVIDGLTCVEDGVTYDITVTSSSGEDKTYYSANKACDAAQELNYVKTEEISSLIPLLFTY